jgi:hypothetical protein
MKQKPTFSSARAAATDWQTYATAGDEWLVMHAMANQADMVPPLGPYLFTAGHALELYLKAVGCKRTGLLPSWTHDLETRWHEEKSADPALLTAHSFHPDRLADYKAGLRLDDYVAQGRPPAELLEFQAYAELFPILESVVDLKYLHLPTTALSLRQISFFMPSEIMTGIFGSIRRHLGWPVPDRADRVQDYATHAVLTEFGRRYLRMVLAASELPV